MKTIIPMGEYLLVEQVAESNQTASGIVLPDNSKEKPSYGKVLAIGEGSKNPDGNLVAITNISIGDVVYFQKYATEEIESNEDGVKTKFLLVKASSVFAKVG